MPQILIRPAELSDAEALQKIYQYYVERTAVSFEYTAPTPAEFRERMRAVKQRFPYLVILRDGEIAGYAYAGAFHPREAYHCCVETTIYLARTAQGQGLGRRLYTALEDELRAGGFRNLYACIACPEEPDEYLTDASEAFHIRLGYRRCGYFHRCGLKFGRWYSMIWMEKLLYDDSPAR